MSNEISKETWGSFADDFSRRNQGRPTRLEIFGELGAQEEEQHLPFNGITIDASGTDAPRVAILLGNDAFTSDPVHNNQHITHMVNSVTQILPLCSDAGNDEALEIVCANGEKTLLRFLPQPNANQ